MSNERWVECGPEDLWARRDGTDVRFVIVRNDLREQWSASVRRGDISENARYLGFFDTVEEAQAACATWEAR